jgi:hypothetical protein
MRSSSSTSTAAATKTGTETTRERGTTTGPLQLKISRFAFNKTFEQAFVDGIRGFNRPTNVKFGPDGCAWVSDYGAVRDFGQSDPDSKFKVAGDGPLLQIPGTGVIWRICPN